MKLKELAKKIRRKIRNFFLNSNFSASIIYYFYRILCATYRYKLDRTMVSHFDKQALDRKNGIDSGSDLAVFCLWHDELFPLLKLKKNLDIICVVSPSKDGNILNNLLVKLGLKTVSGSSRKDGLKALLKGAKMMREEKIHICITVDGPMGPRHKVKDGAFLLALKTGAKIIPVRILMSKSYKFSSWDKFQIPLPFSKVEVRVGEGFFITEELTEETLVVHRQNLENGLENLEKDDFGTNKS